MTTGSVLIIGNSLKNREKKVFEIIKKVDEKFVEKENADLFIVNKEKGKNSIGIDAIRKSGNFLSTKPYSSKSKIVVIHEAQLLTVQAQNALLKTLEEPPVYALIILSAKTENSLLPTVLSRCRKIKADGTEDLVENTYELSEIKKMDFGQKLELAQEIAKLEKEEVIAVLENILRQSREEMLSNPTENNAKFVKKTLEIKKDIESTNVNMRLAIENVLIIL